MTGKFLVVLTAVALGSALCGCGKKEADVKPGDAKYKGEAGQIDPDQQAAVNAEQSTR